MNIQEILTINPETLATLPLDQLQRLSQGLSTEFNSLQVQLARVDEQINTATATLDTTNKRLADEFQVTDEASLTNLLQQASSDLKQAHADLVAAYKVDEETSVQAPTA